MKNQATQNPKSKRVLVAGASGVVGRILCQLLIADGYAVTGTTRSPEKASGLADLGITPVVVDVFDSQALLDEVITAQPHVVIHQLTDLPDGLDPAQMEAARVRNARIREVGTSHLIAAALAAGAERFIAQSIAFAYAPGPLPHGEDDPLSPDARGVIRLEEQVLSAPLTGIVLRYGKFYGPGTGFDIPQSDGPPVHVDAAADAARRAITQGKRGIYNIAEDDGTVTTSKATTALGWSPTFRLSAVKEN